MEVSYLLNKEGVGLRLIRKGEVGLRLLLLLLEVEVGVRLLLLLLLLEEVVEKMFSILN